MASPLNKDVVTKILLHLPQQSLLRFRAVCKFWCDVIDSLPFRKSHIQQHANNNYDDDTVLVQFKYLRDGISKPSILVDTGKSSLKSYDDFPALEQFFNDNLRPGYIETEPGRFVTESSRYVRVVGPVNGVICIHRKQPNGDIAVCNPSLGQIKMLPLYPMCYFSSHRGVGIGFDDVVQDYKIVQLLSCDVHRRLHASLYSRATNSWRELGDVLDQYLLIKEPIKSSCRNGAVAQWRAIRVVGEGRHPSLEHIILSFDMKNEVFRSFEVLDYASLVSLGKVKIFARGDTFVLFISDSNMSYTRTRKPFNWMRLLEARLEGNNTLRWDYVKQIGPFQRFIPRSKTLWRSDCVVWNQFSTKNKLVFYDYCDEKIVGSFEIDYCSKFKIFEYKGSFVSS